MTKSRKMSRWLVPLLMACLIMALLGVPALADTDPAQSSYPVTGYQLGATAQTTVYTGFTCSSGGAKVDVYAIAKENPDTDQGAIIAQGYTNDLTAHITHNSRIQLLDSFAGGTYTAGTATTLDLQGHSIGTVYTNASAGTLTIIDSVGGGSATVIGQGATANLIIGSTDTEALSVAISGEFGTVTATGKATVTDNGENEINNGLLVHNSANVELDEDNLITRPSTDEDNYIITVTATGVLKMSGGVVEPNGNNRNEAVHISGTSEVVFDGTEITSYNQTQAIYLTGYPVPGSKANLTFSGDTVLNAYSQRAVYLYHGARFDMVATGTGLDLKEPIINAKGGFGVYLHGNHYQTPCVLNMEAGEINIDTRDDAGRHPDVNMYNYTNVCTAVYVYEDDSYANLSGGQINVTVNSGEANTESCGEGSGVDSIMDSHVSLTGAEINVNVTQSFGEGYGLYVTHSTDNIINDETEGSCISMTASDDSIELYGVYIDASVPLDSQHHTYDYNPASVTMQNGMINLDLLYNTHLNNRLVGVTTIDALPGSEGDGDSSFILEGGNINVNSVIGRQADASTYAYGMYAYGGINTIEAGAIEVIGPAGMARGIVLADAAYLAFTGGALVVDGDRAYGIELVSPNALLKMGEHNQTTINDAPGVAGHPYIGMNGDSNAVGIYMADGTAIIHAGLIDISGDAVSAIYEKDGNLQILTDSHEKATDSDSETIIFSAIANGANSKALYVAGGNFAVRGQGSVFQGAQYGLYALDAFDDGGYCHDTGCVSILGEPAPALSGGTFVATNILGSDIYVENGELADMLLPNHYVRDDSEQEGDFTAASNGQRVIDVTDLNDISYGAATITNAEWEIRYALEYDNDIQYYWMPIDITLGANDSLELHGLLDDGLGDLDVCDGATSDDHRHRLALRSHTLKYNSTATNDAQVIDVNEGGNLSVFDHMQIVSNNEGSTTVSYREGDGVILNERAGNAIRNAGELRIYGGLIRGGASNANGIGLLQTDGQTTIKGGHIISGANARTASCNIKVDNGDLLIYRGVIGDMVQSYGGNTGILFDNAGKIGDEHMGILFVGGGEIYGNYGGYPYSSAIEMKSGVAVIAGGIISGDRNANTDSGLSRDLNKRAIYVNGEEATVNIAAAAAHTIGRVDVAAGYLNMNASIDDLKAQLLAGDEFTLWLEAALKDEDMPTMTDPLSKIYALHVTGEKGSAYVMGGEMLNDSSIQNGEMLVEGGTFDKDLNASGGRTYFKALEIDEKTTQMGKVAGTTTVTGANTVFYVDDGLFNIFQAHDNGIYLTTNPAYDADIAKMVNPDVQLHGGYYTSIKNLASDVPINEEFSTGLTCTDSCKLIPANHYVAELDYANGVLGAETDREIRITLDTPEVAATTGNKLAVKYMDSSDIYDVLDKAEGGRDYVGGDYKLRCYIDLNPQHCVATKDIFRASAAEPELGIELDMFGCAPAMSGTINVTEGTHTLDLNGFGMRYTDAPVNSPVIDVSGTGYLTIVDTNRNFTTSPTVNPGQITMNSNNNHTLSVQRGGTLDIHEAYIYGYSGDAIYVNGGTLKTQATYYHDINIYSVNNNAVSVASGNVDLFGSWFEGGANGISIAGGDVLIRQGQFIGGDLTADGNYGVNHTGGNLEILVARFDSINTTVAGATVSSLLADGRVLYDNCDYQGQEGGGIDTARVGNKSYIYEKGHAFLTNRSVLEDGTNDNTIVGSATNHTVNAYFAVKGSTDAYTVTAAVTDTAGATNGTVTPSRQSVSSGGKVDVVMTPNAGYHINAITVDGVALTGNDLYKYTTAPAGVAQTYTFENVTTGHSLEVSYSSIYLITGATTGNNVTMLATAEPHDNLTGATAVGTGESWSADVTGAANGVTILKLTATGWQAAVAGTDYTFTPTAGTTDAAADGTYAFSNVGASYTLTANGRTGGSGGSGSGGSGSGGSGSGGSGSGGSSGGSTGGSTGSTGSSTVELITDDHFAYIEGFDDGTFRPAAGLTRAEASAIFYRLLVDKTYSNAPSFSDVSRSNWHYTFVSALAAKDILEGYEDGTFRPDDNITRAEFCAMASRFFEVVGGTVSFTDVPTTHWAYSYIASAYNHDWLEGYGNTFNPNGVIGRAEVVVIVNNMVGRTADRAFVNSSDELATFSDVSTRHANYYDIMEAANGHDFTADEDGDETWQNLK